MLESLIPRSLYFKLKNQSCAYFIFWDNKILLVIPGLPSEFVESVQPLIEVIFSIFPYYSLIINSVTPIKQIPARAEAQNVPASPATP